MSNYISLPKKLILKKAISDVFARSHLFRNKIKCDRSFRALNYHSITDAFVKNDIYRQMTTPRESFAEQMKFLSENNYNILSCDEAVNMIKTNVPIPPTSVCITFDDGFKDNLTNALPVLQRYGFKATIFLTVDYIKNGAEYLDWSDIRFLLKTGLIGFGAHSLSHKRLRGLNRNNLEKELRMSKHILEDNLKTVIDLFAYPFGSYGSFDINVKEALRLEGYKAAFTTIAGINTSKTDLFMLRRTRISWYDDEKEFLKELAGDYDWYSIWQMLGRTA